MAAEVNWSEIAERLDHIFRNVGHSIALATAFLSIWFACIALGFIIPMNTLDHGDVASAMGATIFASLGAIVGPILAYFVVRSIRRGGI
jgi:hypothetical protein